MKLKELQKEVYKRRKLENLNILWINSELNTIGELSGTLAMHALNYTSPLKELKNITSVDNFNAVIENAGWLLESCLALSAMFAFDPDRFPDFKTRFLELPATLRDYLPYIMIEYGALQGIFRKAKHKDTTKFQERDAFQIHLARLSNYILDLLNALEVNPEVVIKKLCGVEMKYGGLVS
ncbi:MAG: hypothetical protein QW728_04315 [Thermoplasmata archaeon]